MKTYDHIQNIAIAGSGNIASHLAKGLHRKGFNITGIWSRDFSNAKKLADECESTAFNGIAKLSDGADLIIIAVPDSAIQDVSLAMGKFDGIVVHTAGSVPMDILSEIGGTYGILYPMQTFSKDIPVDLRTVPFFIESSSPETGQKLTELASKLSDFVFECDSNQRLLLHTAAVFAGNFSNLMYILGNELLKSTNLPPEVLHPLIAETARKAISGDPLKTQTGPARRGDKATIEKHLKVLGSLPEYAELYLLLSRIISEKYK